MESNNNEDYSKSSSEEEIDRSDQSNHGYSSSRRSYECVFCRRGFSTAQALGGHMNIHRKDRTKNRRSSNNSVATPSLSRKVNGDETTLRSSYYPIQGYQSQYHCSSFPIREVHPNCTFFPDISWGLGSSHTKLHSDDSLVKYPHPYLNLFRKDRWSSLRLNISSSRSLDDKSMRGEDELDLELRLGYDP